MRDKTGMEKTNLSNLSHYPEDSNELKELLKENNLKRQVFRLYYYGDTPPELIAENVREQYGRDRESFTKVDALETLFLYKDDLKKFAPIVLGLLGSPNTTPTRVAEIINQEWNYPWFSEEDVNNIAFLDGIGEIP